ncbi:MAG: hypothetical protein AUJ92_11170 [Armatimonadetes bacterium CG2_30_59_28]|nr:acyl carrier protein [Armatimonadota bacterium]OIO94014.1 MAG: hypothetical protein AUJ92_11170 [Armatimonadetes bacterium CG2_30_59_28]PIU62408.1 MAG: acyl carrier protein [Armatimonadetes bacterium CG07_land_8_20_14_0_80_59_28]PIX44401.1 MAG: acyl carrier protein [Armatimonadetes bacterium CG_4_8_14_3_um_filter_58_9]PIY48956.1 MAG: acyl carrier protein [Armatimonadetes bacterium CG_4_10_14_3_um_filter_59_10]PJB62495.1 MAG: acyl carrier protein [Armatimonadetes bacterium CG_4_9_14_3_um_fil
MSRDEIRDQVFTITAREFGLDAGAIQESDQFVDDLGADSLKSIELVAAYEEEFELDLNEEEALRVQTVGGAIDFFEKLLV